MGGFENAEGPLVLVALGVTLIGAAVYRADRTARLASATQQGR